MRLALLVTGASGMRLPAALLAAAAPRPEVERLHLVVSAGAGQVLRHELPGTGTGAETLLAAAGLSGAAAAKILVHRDGELDAPLASGSYRLAGTVVLPCSAATLGAIATGASRHLVPRAAAVALKERWPLLLGFRETPLSLVHLENLRRVTYAGAIVAPPIPAFYAGEDLATFVDAYVLRLLDHLGLPGAGRQELRWGGGD